MTTWLSLIALGGVWLQAARWSKLDPAPALVVAVAGSLGVLFIGGMLGALDASVWLLRTGGLLGLTTGVYVWGRRGKRSAPPLELAVPVALVVGFWALHHSATYLYYDEFAHWGIFLKEMLARGDFWGADTNAMHPRYLPGSTLWQYYFSQGVSGPRVDGVAYLAQFILLIAPLALLWSRLQWQEWPWALGLLLVVVLGLAAFSPGVTSLYVDHLLSAWFLGSLLLYLHLREARGWQMALVALPLLVLALIKEVGLALAMAAVAAIALDAVWRGQRAADGWQARLRGGFTAALVASFLLLPALVATLSWKAQRDAWGVEHSRSSVVGVVGALFGQARDVDEELMKEIDRRFVEVALSQQLAKSALSWEYNAFSYPLRGLYQDKHRLSLVAFVVAWVACWLVVIFALLPSRSRRDAAWIGISVLAALAGYVLMLWVNYRFTLGAYGLELSSILRYFHVLVLPMFLVLLWALSPGFRRITGGDFTGSTTTYQVMPSAAAFVMILAAYAWWEPPFLRPLFASVGDFPLREATEEVTSKVRRLAGAGPVWVFLPNDQPNEFFGRFLQFQLSPVPARIERSMDFWDRDTESVMRALRVYTVLWFPTEGYELDSAARIIGSKSPSGIYIRQQDGRFIAVVGG